MLDIGIVASSLALSAARRYEKFAIDCNKRLEKAFASSERLSLSSLGPSPPQGFSPIGWDGPSFSHTLCANALTLRAKAAWSLTGPKLCRVFFRIAHRSPSLLSSTDGSFCGPQLSFIA